MSSTATNTLPTLSQDSSSPIHTLASIQNANSSLLLLLPPELRNRIYSFVFSDIAYHVSRGPSIKAYNYTDDISQNTRVNHPFALTQVCRQLRYEANLYPFIKGHFVDIAYDFFPSVRARQQRQLDDQKAEDPESEAPPTRALNLTANKGLACYLEARRLAFRDPLHGLLDRITPLQRGFISSIQLSGKCTWAADSFLTDQEGDDETWRPPPREFGLTGLKFVVVDMSTVPEELDLPENWRGALRGAFRCLGITEVDADDEMLEVDEGTVGDKRLFGICVA